MTPDKPMDSLLLHEKLLTSSSIRHKRCLLLRDNGRGFEQACESHKDLRFLGVDKNLPVVEKER
jgi:hypothetical protein